MAKKIYVALRGDTDDCETTFLCSPRHFENFIIELDEEVTFRLQSYIAKEGIKLVELIPPNEAKIDIKRLIDQFEVEEEKKKENLKKLNEKYIKDKKLTSLKDALKDFNKDEIREALKTAGYIENDGVL